jgi:hypothetical protein
MLLASATVVGVATALTACGPTPGDPASTPSETVTAEPTPTETPTADPAPSPSAPVALPGANVIAAQPGDCGFDPSGERAVAFIVTGDDATTPIIVTFSAFRVDGDPELRTVTSVGPTVLVLQSSCGNPVPPWTFTATSATENSLGCASFYGGKLLRSDNDYAEGDIVRGTSVDCSGYPGT